MVKQVANGVEDVSNFKASDSHSPVVLNKPENRKVTTELETFESRKAELVSEISKLPSESNTAPSKTSDFSCTSTQSSLSYKDAVDNFTNPKIVISAPDDDLTTNPLSIGLPKIHEKSKGFAKSFHGRINGKNLETLSNASDDVSYSSMYSSEETISHEGSRGRSSTGIDSNMDYETLRQAVDLSDETSSNSSFQKEQQCRQFIGLKPPTLNYSPKSKMPEKVVTKVESSSSSTHNTQVGKSDYPKLEVFRLKSEILCQPGLAVTLHIPGCCTVECEESTFNCPVTGIMADCAFLEQVKLKNLCYF